MSMTQKVPDAIVRTASQPLIPTFQATVNGPITKSWMRTKKLKMSKHAIGNEFGSRPTFATPSSNSDDASLGTVVLRPTNEAKRPAALLLDIALTITFSSTSALMSESSHRIAMAPGQPMGSPLWWKLARRSTSCSPSSEENSHTPSSASCSSPSLAGALAERRELGDSECGSSVSVRESPFSKWSLPFSITVPMDGVEL
mmetsp:Transcript_71757/g.190849  ORF Transcript_71757/g.190849 Transcript_71757/m.190849 type:complete len:200 (-) Transcript_71757:268-867(-)